MADNVLSVNFKLAEYWEIPKLKDVPRFFRELPNTLPQRSRVYFEGTAIVPELQTFFKTNAVHPSVNIPRATQFPPSQVVLSAVDVTLFNNLASVSEGFADNEICDHMLGYRGTEPLFQWFDAFECPIFFSLVIPEERIAHLCRSVESVYSSGRLAS